MSDVTVDLNEIAPTAPEFEDSPPARPRRPWLTWAAVALLVIASAAGGWYVAGNTAGSNGSGDLPVVRADPAPIKTRPDAPGGMEVPDRDKLVYERLQGRSSPTRVEKMLPPPEAPKPLNSLAPAAGPAARKAPPMPPPLPPEAPGGPRVVSEGAAPAESLLPPKTTAAPVAGKLDGPPKTIAELVSATVQEDGQESGTSEGPAAEAATAPAAPAKTEAAKSEPVKTEPVKSEPAKTETAETETTETEPAKTAPMVVAKTEPPKPETAPAKTGSAAAERVPPPPAAPVAKPATASPAAENRVAAKAEAAKPTVPAPTPAKPVVKPAAKPVAKKMAAAATGYRIQIAAVRSADAAAREWARLQKKNADLLGGLASMIEKADLGKKGIYYRIRAGMIADKPAARELCAALKQRKIGCIVLRQGS